MEEGGEPFSGRELIEDVIGTNIPENRKKDYYLIRLDNVSVDGWWYCTIKEQGLLLQ